MAPVLGDGRPPLLVVAGGLLFAGGFALFLAAAGEFLPHDIRYLGMSADDLCDVASCRIVDFMIHDRAAFGGTLLGLGVVYVWLTVFPLAAGEQWAWWAWLVSGTVGFLSFLSYLGYGYLDTWHGLATLALLPAYVVGMVRSRRLVGGSTFATSYAPVAGWRGATGSRPVGRSCSSGPLPRRRGGSQSCESGWATRSSPRTSSSWD
jgi:hypothetical protein